MPRKITFKTSKRHTEEHKAKIAAKLREVNGTPEARAAIAERSRKAMLAYHERARQALALLEQQEADRG